MGERKWICPEDGTVSIGTCRMCDARKQAAYALWRFTTYMECELTMREIDDLVSRGVIREGMAASEVRNARRPR